MKTVIELKDVSKTYKMDEVEVPVLKDVSLKISEKEITAITGPNCHCCKQLIYESSLRSGIDTAVIIEEDGVIKQIPISEMMPYPWPEKISE